MFGFLEGLVETAVKTTVGLPVAIVADIVTVGGELTDKVGHQCYTGDMLDSIDTSLHKMTE